MGRPRGGSRGFPAGRGQFAAGSGPLRGVPGRARAGSRSSPAREDLPDRLVALEPDDPRSRRSEEQAPRGLRWARSRGRHEADGCRCDNRHQVSAVARSTSLPTPLAAVAAGQGHRVRERLAWARTDGRPGTGPAVAAPTDAPEAVRAAVPNLASPGVPATSARLSSPGVPATSARLASPAVPATSARLASPAVPATSVLRGPPPSVRRELPPSLDQRHRRRNRSTQGGHCPQATLRGRPWAWRRERPGRTRPPRARIQPCSRAHHLTAATAQFQTSGAWAPRGLRQVSAQRPGVGLGARLEIELTPYGPQARPSKQRPHRDVIIRKGRKTLGGVNWRGRCQELRKVTHGSVADVLLAGSRRLHRCDLGRGQRKTASPVSDPRMSRRSQRRGPP